MIFVTHQIDEAVFLSDRVFVFARRPGRMQERVEIDLPRPRTLAFKRTPEFVAYVDRIWRLIENDVRDSVRRARVSGLPAALALTCARATRCDRRRRRVAGHRCANAAALIPEAARGPCTRCDRHTRP